MLDTILMIARVLSLIFIFVVIFVERRKPESTIAWVLILTFVPYLGVFLYIMLADSFRFITHKREAEKIVNNKKFQHQLKNQLDYLGKINKDKRINEISSLAMLNMAENNLITSNNDIKTYSKGIDMFSDLIDDINNAKDYIHVSYYIIKRDKYGEKLKNTLIKKLKEGIEVRLIYDQIGSKSTSMKFFKDLVKAGGKVEKFFPSTIWFKPYFNHRNHRKMVIIDGCIGYVGGMNIGKEYCDEDNKLNPWADRHIRINGNGVSGLQIQFFKDYLYVSKEKINFENRDLLNRYFPMVFSSGNIAMQTVASGPDYKDENIKNAYLKMINNAKERVYIETPYLILDDSLKDAIKIAIKSGIEVNVVIPSIPDKKFVYAVTLSYARELIDMGVNVYGYKGFLHSKVVIMDDKIVSIGSANMDRRSFAINFEINAFMYNKEFALENIELIKRDIKNSEYLNLTIKKKNKFGLLLEGLFRLLAPIM